MNLDNPGFVPVYRLTRGGIVESIHFGAAAVVAADGRLLASVGVPEIVAFMRSTSKPFQAMPFVEMGGPAHFGFSAKETALICASHIGSDDHVRTAESIQARSGVHESDLQCGVHLPYDPEARKQLLSAGQEPRPNQHNCSGKHSGMLACARMMGWPIETYLDIDHPLQQRILQTLAGFSDLDPGAIVVGIDGCSAPNFALPLYNAALALARLADPAGLPEARAAACSTITGAMMAHPEMVSGVGQFDTRLMQVGRGRLVVKGGAEGYQGIAVLPGAAAARGIGIAFKISDGSGREGGRSAVALEILRQLGILNATDLEELAGFGPATGLRNFRGLDVGDAAPCFDLQTP